MRGLALFVAVFLLAAQPAHAGFIGAAIGALLGGASVLAIAGKILLSLAIAAYQKRRMQKAMAAAAARQSGITTQFLGEGGTTPLSIVVGRYATAGHLEAPPMSWPANSSPPNLYLTYVIGLGDLPGIKPTGRIVINDEWHSFTDALPAEASFGLTVAGDLQNKCWFRFRDGTEETADELLRSKLGSYADRPWLADMIGRGIPHAIATFKRDQTAFPGEPKLRFEVDGIPLYDPRKDSTVGGDGSQRWSEPATWQFTDNPKVIEYNIHRGIQIDGYGLWGNRVAASDLPLDNWFAAMNACDVLVSDGDGGFEPAYRFGFEWTLDQTPASIIDEINRSCAGETVEIGGVYKTRVGGVGLPVFFFTDDDILVTRPQDIEPFIGLDDTFNALSCSFPDPALHWEAREAPPLTNSAWELEDAQLEFDEGVGGFIRQPRRLLNEISLPAVSNPRQVQRLMSSAAREGRKRRSHALSLPPEALMLEPLDAVSWTSAHNGFANKVFDVVMTVDPVTELRPRIGLLEADPADYTVPAYQSYDTPVVGTSITVALAPPGVPVISERLYTTRSGGGFKVALRLVSSPSPSPDAAGYQWQRLIGSEWRDLLRSALPDIEIMDVELGPWAVRVRTEGVAGKVSDWSEQVYEVGGRLTPPVAIPRLTLQTTGGVALFTWSPHPDADVQTGGSIVIRFSANPVPTWENSHVGWRTFGRNTSMAVPLMPGTYFLRAEDAQGLAGPTTAILATGDQAVGYSPAGNLTETAPFAGTHDGTRPDGTNLSLTSALMFDDVIDEELDASDFDYAGWVLMEGVYTFSGTLDLGVAKRVRLRAHVVQEIRNVVDLFDQTEDSAGSAGDWDGVTGTYCDVQIEVQTASNPDNGDPFFPVWTPIWSDWFPVQSTEVIARGIRARARLMTPENAFTPRVSLLRLNVDEVL